MSTLVCRLCLRHSGHHLSCDTLTMQNIEDIQLVDLYEKLIGAEFDSDDRLPTTMCAMCSWQMKKCLKLSKMALQSQKILNKLLESGSEITNNTISQSLGLPILSLSLSGIKITSSDDVEEIPEKLQQKEIKEENFEVKIEEQDAIKSNQDLAVKTVIETPEKVRKKEKRKPINGTQKYNCKFCSKKFTSEKAYSMHFRKHLSQKHSPCRNCTFTNQTKRRVENRKTRHFCEICDKCFTAKKSLEVHMNTHNNERPYVCEICGQSFAYRSNMARHIKVAHNVTENEKPFSCKMCDKTFKFEPFLIRHQKLHTNKDKFKPRYTCDICNWTFGYKSNLQRHMRTHTGEKPFSCAYCGKMFSIKGSLTVHLRIHTRVTPYQCPECNISFTQKVHLTTHIRIIHRGDKPFSCERCAKTFTMRSNLKKHLKRHAIKDLTHPLSV